MITAFISLSEQLSEKVLFIYEIFFIGRNIFFLDCPSPLYTMNFITKRTSQILRYFENACNLCGKFVLPNEKTFLSILFFIKSFINLLFRVSFFIMDYLLFFDNFIRGMVLNLRKSFIFLQCKQSRTNKKKLSAHSLKIMNNISSVVYHS